MPVSSIGETQPYARVICCQRTTCAAAQLAFDAAQTSRIVLVACSRSSLGNVSGVRVSLTPENNDDDS